MQQLPQEDAVAMDQSAHDYGPPDHTQHRSYQTQPLDLETDAWHDQASGDSPRRAVLRIGPMGKRVLAGVLLSGALAGSGWIYYTRTYAGRIYPNISIQGVNLGMAPIEQARVDLHTRYAPFLQQPLALSFEGRTWTPAPEQLGLQLEIDKAVEAAFATGRHRDVIGNMREVAAVWEYGLELPVELTIDQSRLQSYLASLAAEIEQRPTDAGIEFVGTDVRITPSHPGRQLLVDETLADVTAALQNLQPQTVVVRTRSLPPHLSDEQAAKAAKLARSFLQGPIVLSAEDQTWEVQPEQIAKMLRVQVVNGSADAHKAIKVAIDPQALDPILDEIAEATGSKGKNPRVDWDGGDLTIIKPGTPGYTVDREETRHLILKAIRSNERTITIPFTEVPSEINEANLGSLGIKELISVGRSDFSGSAAYRITNIQAGMRLLHGILVAPDAEFSFNENIGRIDESNGFVEGYAIVQNRTQLEWGGGICQDSTTMFRAAFWAGLPITERWGHSFYISWYDKYGFGEYGNGPGMDATIFTGGPDLKFVNDTGHWLLIQAYANPDTAVAEVRIYGTKPDRTVELIGPEIRNRVGPPSQPQYAPDPRQPRGTRRQSDTARGGMDIYYSRVIVENGVSKAPEEFVTRFKPWPNIFVVNPADMPGARPAAPAGPEPEATPTPNTAQPTPPADAAQPAPTQEAQPPTSEQPPASEQPAPVPPPENGQPIGEQPPPAEVEQPVPEPAPPVEEQPAPEPAPPVEEQPAPPPPQDGQPIGG